MVTDKVFDGGYLKPKMRSATIFSRARFHLSHHPSELTQAHPYTSYVGFTLKCFR